MNTFTSITSIVGAGAVAATLLASPLASADFSPNNAFKAHAQNGVQFVTGGVGNTEQARLSNLAADYNVRLALTRPDGAYLADVDVVIEDAGGDPLVEVTTDGPIVLAQLKPGRYHVTASMDGRTTERRTIDVPNLRDQVRLYVALEEAS